MRISRSLTLALSAALIAASVALGKDAKSELQKAMRDEALVGDWIYDDIDAGFARAVREKKPVCIVFR